MWYEGDSVRFLDEIWPFDRERRTILDLCESVGWVLLESEIDWVGLDDTETGGNVSEM